MENQMPDATEASLVGAIVSSITDIERARALPETAEGGTYSLSLVADGGIDRFMDEGPGGRRVMRIVADDAGVLHKLHCPLFGEVAP